MILNFTYLILILEFASCGVIEIAANGQIIKLGKPEHRDKIRPNLRINFGRQDNDKWDHISDSLVRFLKCVGPAASHIPPITIGKYKLTVLDCLAHGYSVKQLQKDSEHALEKEVPWEVKAVFRCFSRIDPEDDNKNSDEKGHIAQIIQCSNEGNILKATQVLRNKTIDSDTVQDNKQEENSDKLDDAINKTLQTDTIQDNIREENREKFAAAFRKCILDSPHSSHESKVMDCMNTFKENKSKFYIQYSPASIISIAETRYLRSGVNNKEYVFRVSDAKISADVSAVIIIVKKHNKRKGKRTRIYLAKKSDTYFI